MAKIKRFKTVPSRVGNLDVEKCSGVAAELGFDPEPVYGKYTTASRRGTYVEIFGQRPEDLPNSFPITNKMRGEYLPRMGNGYRVRYIETADLLWFAKSETYCCGQSSTLFFRRACREEG